MTLLTRAGLFLSLFAGLFSVALQPALAGTSEEDKAQDAAVVLRELVRIPEKGIPPRLLEQAYAIAVIPEVLKVGFVFGGRRGEGVLAVRTDSGKWSNPSFIALTGASVGFQIGASSTDIVLVFKNRKSIDRITKGKITLGGDASVAAGPVGRSAEAATDIRCESEVYSYSRARGVFAGVSAEGASLSIDDTGNADFYDDRNIGPHEIFASTNRNALPDAGKDFMRTLEKYAPTHGTATQRAPGQSQ